MGKNEGQLTSEQQRELINFVLEDDYRAITFFLWIQSYCEARGISLPTVCIEYKGAAVQTMALPPRNKLPTIASVTWGFFKGDMFGGPPTRELMIISDMDGVLNSGRMTAVVGPPGSGRSSYLRMLSGHLDGVKTVKVKGEFKYNGHAPDQFHRRSSIAYVNQFDDHAPNLSVVETMVFAYACQNGRAAGRRTMSPEAVEVAKRVLSMERGPQGPRGPPLEGLMGVYADREVEMGGVEGSVTEQGAGEHEQPRVGTTEDVQLEVDDSEAEADPGRAKDGYVEDMDKVLRAESETMGTEDEGGDIARAPMPSVPSWNPTVLEAEAMKVGFQEGNEEKLQHSVLAGLSTKEMATLIHSLWFSPAKVDVLLRLVGLHNQRNTNVGNHQVRGISGGERRRLSFAEMMCGPRTVYMLDEIGTGQDSATIFRILQWMKQATCALGYTTVASMMVVSQEVLTLFDDIIVLAEGRRLYHGPVQGAIPFFESCGFIHPPRMDTMSFVYSVLWVSGDLEATLQSSPEVHHILPREADGSFSHVPMLAQLESTYLTTCSAGTEMMARLQQPFNKAAGHPDALARERYANRWYESCFLVWMRQLSLTAKDPVLVQMRLLQVIIVAVLIGTIWLRLPFNEAGIVNFEGAITMVIIATGLSAFPYMNIMTSFKRVFWKHAESNFYSAVPQGLAFPLSQVPLSVVETLLIMLIITWLMIPTSSFQTFLLNWVILFLYSISFTSMIRSLSVPNVNPAVFQALVGLLFSELINACGYPVFRHLIPDWMIWLYYISPMQYALTGIVVSEFKSGRWDAPITQDDGSQIKLGDFGLLLYDQPRSWGAVGYSLLGLVVVIVLFEGLTIVGFSYVGRMYPPAIIKKKEERDNRLFEPTQSQPPQKDAGVTIQMEDQPIKWYSGAEDAGTEPPAVHDPPQGPTPEPEAPEDRSVLSTMSDVPAWHGEETNSTGLNARPFIPITLVFFDIRYTVENPGYNSKVAEDFAKRVNAAAAAGQDLPPKPFPAKPILTILDGVTAYAQPGGLTALMGGSGSGKSTLMDVLANRKTVGKISGQIYANGRPTVARSWSNVVGYVEQNDIHSPTFSVYDSVYFSARMRLPKDTTKAQVKAYVDDVLKLLELDNLRGAIVGIPGAMGLTAEARKRLTAAVELVANPSVIFMDEPTSGLDTRAGVLVMRAVRNMARSGRTVVVAIHQPPIEIFEAFDNLLVLQRGGHLLYFGPVGQHSNAVTTYIMAVPGVVPPAPGHNPASWMMEVMGCSAATLVNPVRADWDSMYLNSDLAHSNEAKARELVQNEDLLASPPLPVNYPLSFWGQLKYLLIKYNLIWNSSMDYNMARLLVTALGGLINGLLFFQVGAIPNPASFSNVSSCLGAIFEGIAIVATVSRFSSLPVITQERAVQYREHPAGYYSVAAFACAMFVVEIPWMVLQSLILVMFTFFLQGMTHTFINWLYFVIGYFFVLCNCGTALGLAQVYLTPNPGLALTFGSFASTLLFSMSGFMISFPRIPDYWRWLVRIIPTSYSLWGLAAHNLKDNQNSMIFQGDTYTVDGFVSSYWEFSNGLIWWVIAIQVLFAAIILAFAFLGLRFLKFNKR